jgi:hypothetical protein
MLSNQIFMNLSQTNAFHNPITEIAISGHLQNQNINITLLVCHKRNNDIIHDQDILKSQFLLFNY